MTAIIEKSFSYFVSSAAASSDPNVNLTVNNTKLTIGLDTPLVFSSSSVVTTLELTNASIWNTTYNISTALNNNKLYYYISGILQPVLTIPDGLYSVTLLNIEVQRLFSLLAISPNPIQITGNTATSQSILTLAQNYQVDFTFTGTLKDILGFNSGIFPSVPAPSNNYQVFSNNIAKFNKTNNIYVITNFLNGISINNSNFGVIAQIPIDANIGSIINYAPVNPSKVDANILRGSSLQNLVFQLVDDTGLPYAQTEPWSLSLLFRQSVLLSTSRVPILDLF